MRKSSLYKLILAALFSALAFLTVYILRIPFVPAVGFLKYEAKDAVIALESLILGPSYSVMTSVVVSLIEMVTMSETGIIGAIMNVISTVTFILPVGLMYKRNRTVKTAVTGLLLGSLLTTATMLLWNYLISPYYMGVSREVIASLLLPGFLPYNLVKSLINACLTYLLYKPVITTLRKAKLLPQSENSGSQKGGNMVITVICIVIIALAVAGAVYITLSQKG